MGRLRSVEIPLETITPVWTGGAAYQPELRPPSVRGCMRYWFRALVGGVVEGLDDLRAAETAVFGGPQRASSVVIRLAGDPRTGPSPIAPAESPGVAYMHWSMYQRKREAILPGERFSVQIRARPPGLAPLEVRGRRIGMEEAYELASGAVWLFLRLGSVGARCRRCAGTLRTVATPAGWPETLPPLVSSAGTAEELAAELARGVRQIRERTGWQSLPPPPVPPFDILHPASFQLYVIDRPFATWPEAVNWAGETFLAFRRAHVEDASGIARLLTQGRIAARTIQRAVLGLPIVFFFKSMYEALTGQGSDPRQARARSSATVSPRRGQSRGSPLFFRVARLAREDAPYVVLTGVFRARLLPDDTITVRPQERGTRSVELPVPADFSLIDRWFDHLREQHAPLVPASFA